MAMTPIEVELLRNALASICDEMYVALMKSAYSTNIKERHDHSTVIFDAAGRIVVQGDSLPLHLASMLGLAELVLEHHPDRAAEAQAHLDFAIGEFRAMGMAPSLERALRRKGLVGGVGDS